MSDDYVRLCGALDFLISEAKDDALDDAADSVYRHIDAIVFAVHPFVNSAAIDALRAAMVKALTEALGQRRVAF